MTTAGAASRRESLAAVAREVVATQGLAAATLREIARAAGCTTGSIGHAFANRDDLVHEVARQVLADRAAATDQALVEHLLPLDARRRSDAAVWVGLLSASLSDPTLRRLLSESHREHRLRVRRSSKSADDGELALLAALGASLHALNDSQQLSPTRRRALLRRLRDWLHAA